MLLLITNSYAARNTALNIVKSFNLKLIRHHLNSLNINLKIMILFSFLQMINYHSLLTRIPNKFRKSLFKPVIVFYTLKELNTMYQL